MSFIFLSVHIMWNSHFISSSACHCNTLYFPLSGLRALCASYGTEEAEKVLLLLLIKKNMLSTFLKLILSLLFQVSSSSTELSQWWFISVRDTLRTLIEQCRSSIWLSHVRIIVASWLPKWLENVGSVLHSKSISSILNAVLTNSP